MPVLKKKGIIQTPCSKFLLGIEGYSIFRYCLKTKQQFRIAGSVAEKGYKDGTRNESRFNWPRNLTLSKNGETLFVADSYNKVIRAICVVTGMTTTFTGQVDVRKCIDGPKEQACFNRPDGLKLSPDGNTLFVADHHSLRTIHIVTGQVNTIHTFDKYIYGFKFSKDGKYVFIMYLFEILKYNLETDKSKLILEEKSTMFSECDISKDGQLIFVPLIINGIKVVNIDTDQIIDTITTHFKPTNVTVSKNGKQLYINDLDNHKIQVLDISKYCTNFKIFLKSQLAKHSFLPPQVIKTCSI
jgi:DNA-binding beta-propeller fold protein YncE